MSLRRSFKSTPPPVKRISMRQVEKRCERKRSWTVTRWREDAKKHIAYMSNLPFFICSLQPKEGFVSSNFASQSMYMATQAEIDRHLSIIEKHLIEIPDGASKELRLQELTIYKIPEGQLMYLYYNKNMKGYIDYRLKHMGLGNLINSLMQSGLYVIPNDRLMDITNALLHDPEASFTKKQLHIFLSDVKKTIEQIR